MDEVLRASIYVRSMKRLHMPVSDDRERFTQGHVLLLDDFGAPGVERIESVRAGGGRGEG